MQQRQTWKILTRLDKLNERNSRSDNDVNPKVEITDSSMDKIRELIRQVFGDHLKMDGEDEKLNAFKEEVSKIKDIINAHNEVVSFQLKSQDTKQSELTDHLNSYFQQSKDGVEMLKRYIHMLRQENLICNS